MIVQECSSIFAVLVKKKKEKNLNKGQEILQHGNCLSVSISACVHGTHLVHKKLTRKSYYWLKESIISWFLVALNCLFCL